MLARQTSASLLLVCCLASVAQAAEEVRFIERDGVTYRETRRVEQRPVVETQLQQSTQTVYQQQDVTELRDAVQERWTPVTEYRWEAFWVNRWNPFSQPYLAYRYVPNTRWERKTETVKTPVVVRRIVPRTQVVQVPTTTQRMVEQEVITRVAVGGPAAPAARPMPQQVPWTVSPTATARLMPVARDPGPIGSVQRLDSDPPRQSASTAWRSSDGASR
ncbi:MAG TPA: hypothetical protein VJL29_08670 [Thermoguttaceae bacterium]|nr:hypothetical protein [Thermoguttaceae bacterium]